MEQKFITPDRGPYFLNHSVGPVTQKGLLYLEEHYVEPWREGGGRAWPFWLTLLDRFSGALAKLLGGREDEFAHQPNLSTGLSKYLLSLPCSDNPLRILMHASAFPSMGFVVSALPSEGYELILIPEDRLAHDPHVWAEYVTSDIDIVLITHAHSMTGILSNVGDIARIAKNTGARVLVDTAQSAGIIPIHIPDWDVDAVFGSCIKWLCGGPGAGWMWVKAESLPDLTPLSAGWFAHENPFEFDIRNFRFSETAKKFWDGTPSVAPYAMALGGIETILDVGVETIRAHNLEMLGIMKPDIDGAINGGTLCFEAGDHADEIENKLNAMRAYFDRRGSRLRISPHLSIREDEAIAVRDILT